VTVTFLLPRERKFVRSEGLVASGKQMLRHFRNPQLMATYAVGFGVLFNFLVTFTYINFRLAHPPYSLSPGWLGAIFIVYLAGSLITPLTGTAVGRFGRRAVMIGTISIWGLGIALTLLEPLWIILLGLAMSAACGLMSQSVSTGYVAVTAHSGRSSAVGLYVSCYNLGGSFGAAVGGFVWTFGGWPACVGLVALTLAIMAIIIATSWERGTKAGGPGVVEPA
jgi:predicted MFS family arabinose efflux permease